MKDDTLFNLLQESLKEAAEIRSGQLVPSRIFKVKRADDKAPQEGYPIVNVKPADDSR